MDYAYNADEYGSLGAPQPGPDSFWSWLPRVADRNAGRSAGSDRMQSKGAAAAGVGSFAEPGIPAHEASCLDGCSGDEP